MTALRLADHGKGLSLPADDPTQRCPDIGLAKRTLGWEPKVSLEDGLKEAIDYFRRLLA